MEFLHRFDVWLPLNDKNGDKIDRLKFIDVQIEIRRRFGGLTTTPIVGNPVYEGYWEDPDTKKPSLDVSTIYTVLTPKDFESYQFFVEKKEVWVTLFNYQLLLITVYPVEVLTARERKE